MTNPSALSFWEIMIKYNQRCQLIYMFDVFKVFFLFILPPFL